MLEPILEIDNLIFVNYLIPSRFIQPNIPEPLRLDKVVWRFRYHSYLSIVFVAFRGLRVNERFIPLPLAQLNYRTYVNLYGKSALCFLRSFVTGLPQKLLQRGPLPVDSFQVETVVEKWDPDGWPARMRVDGFTPTSQLAIHVDRSGLAWQPDDPEGVADLVDRNLGIFPLPSGRFLFFKVSHAPLYVRPARPLLLHFPSIPELPLSLGTGTYLASVWLTGPTEFRLNLSSSFALDALAYFIQQRLDQPPRPRRLKR